MEIIKEMKYKIKTDKNNEMNLYLRNYNNEELSITLFTINQIPSKKYELKCNLEEFQKNRFFKIFINIEEIMKEFENKIENSIFIEDANNIIFEITIGLTIINEILLVIEEEEKNKDEIIEELEKNIKELTSKLKVAEKNIKLNEQKEKDKKQELENIIKELTEKLSEKENKLKNSEVNEKNIIKSKILQSNEDKLIISFFNKTENITFNLLYRASEDGDNSKVYHNKCDNTGPNLTLIQTKDGYRFGGYSSVNIQSLSGVPVKDDNAFVFSLDKKRKYIPKDSSGALHMNGGFGPIFGKNWPNYAFIINRCDFLSDNIHHCFECENYGIKENELAGKKDIKVNEIEVFQINFN